MKRKAFIIGVAITVALLMTAGAGMTISRLLSKSNVLINTLEAGSITTKIEEEGEGAVKKSRIRNVGENDCIVRARVTISPAEAASAIELTERGKLWDWSEWENGDGYIYYQGVLTPDENPYTSYLFTGVSLKGEVQWKDLDINAFDVTVCEESVQTQVYDVKTGNMISALDEDGRYSAEKAAEVWAVYQEAEKE